MLHKLSQGIISRYLWESRVLEISWEKDDWLKKLSQLEIVNKGGLR